MTYPAVTTVLIQEPGLTSARPVVADVPAGTLYPSTDDGVIYRSDGTTWDVWADLNTTPTGLTDADIGPVAPNADTTTAYTFVLDDGSRLVTSANAAAVTATIPTNASVAFPVGTMLSIMQKGAGAVTFVGASGVTVHDDLGDHTSAQWATATATKIGTNEWVIGGDVAV